MARPTESQFFKQSCLAVLVDRRGPHGKATPSACTAWARSKPVTASSESLSESQSWPGRLRPVATGPNRAPGREARTLWHDQEGRVAPKRAAGGERAEERRGGEE